MLHHCVGCMWNKRVFFNICWKWKLPLAMMFWLGGIFQWQLLQREVKRSGLMLNTGLFLTPSAIEKPNDLLSLLLAPQRNTYQREMRTLCFLSAVFILKNCLGTQAHVHVGIRICITFTDMCIWITLPKPKLKSSLKLNKLNVTD